MSTMSTSVCGISPSLGTSNATMPEHIVKHPMQSPLLSGSRLRSRGSPRVFTYDNVNSPYNSNDEDDNSKISSSSSSSCFSTNDMDMSIKIEALFPSVFNNANANVTAPGNSTVGMCTASTASASMHCHQAFTDH